MNLKFTIICCCISTLIFSQKKDNPFLKLSTDSIVIYDFGNYVKKDGFAIIDKQGNLSSTVRKSAKLDKEEAKSFTSSLSDTTSFGGGTASCFDPHLGIVYYKNKKVLASINICVGCNRLEASMALKAQQQGKQTEDGYEYYTMNGMSKKFRAKINTLLKKYNFSHQIEEGSVFDE